jgi:hypothetical protein
VQRNAIRGFGRSESFAFGAKVGAEAKQLLFEILGYEDLV